MHVTDSSADPGMLIGRGRRGPGRPDHGEHRHRRPGRMAPGEYFCGGFAGPFGTIPGRTWLRRPGTGSRMPTSVPMKPNGWGDSPTCTTGATSARGPAEVHARHPEGIGRADAHRVEALVVLVH